MRSSIYALLVMCVVFAAKADLAPCAEDDVCFTLGATEGVLAHFPADVHWGHLHAFMAANGITTDDLRTLQPVRSDGNQYVIPASMRGVMPSSEEIAASAVIMDADTPKETVAAPGSAAADVETGSAFVAEAGSPFVDESAYLEPVAPVTRSARSTAPTATELIALRAQAKIAEDALLAEHSLYADRQLTLYVWGSWIAVTAMLLVWLIARGYTRLLRGKLQRTPQALPHEEDPSDLADISALLDDLMQRDPGGFAALIEAKLLSFSIPIATPRGTFHLRFSHCVHSRSRIPGVDRRLSGIFVFDNDERSYYVAMSPEAGEAYLRKYHPHFFAAPAAAQLRAV